MSFQQLAVGRTKFACIINGQPPSDMDYGTLGKLGKLSKYYSQQKAILAFHSRSAEGGAE